MLHRLSELESLWGPFRLFDYQSVRAILAFCTALGLGLLLSAPIIRRLASRDLGQSNGAVAL